MAYWAMRMLSALVCLLPSRVADGLGRALATFAWLFVPAWRKRLATEQVRACLHVDEKEAYRIAKASALRFGPMLFEVLRFPVIARHMEQYVTLEGVEHLKQATAAGRGGVIATAHMGNWELLGGTLAHAGFPILGVAKRQKEQGMDAFINQYRRLIGMEILYNSEVRGMFRKMKEGYIVGLLSDQDPSRHDGIVLNFFDRPTNTVQGPAVMARSAQVPFVPIFIYREANGRHKVLIEKPIEVAHTKDKRADIQQAMQAYQDRLEAQIRQRPADWFWLHDRWKSMRA